KAGERPPNRSCPFRTDCRVPTCNDWLQHQLRALATAENGVARHVVSWLTWRNAHHLHFIHASDAASWSDCAMARRMSRPDLNLLVTLDVLLAEGSVARAAQRLRLSPSAMSRALARLRETTGDPLLVRAGRGLVPTPRALGLREQVSRLVQDGERVLRPAEK